jgi:hypothetical protein
MPTGLDDAGFRGKTGSSLPTAEVTRLTHFGNCGEYAVSPLLAFPGSL